MAVSDSRATGTRVHCSSTGLALAVALGIAATAPTPRPAVAGLSLADRDSVTKKVATITPSEAPAPPPQALPRYDAKSGLAIYNGKWNVSSSGACPHRSRGQVAIENGNIRGHDLSGRISPEGHVSGHFASLGLIGGRFSGRMSSESLGAGTYRNGIGCTGGWTISR